MKHTNKQPSFDVESFTIFAVSGFICGYLLVSGRLPAPILHALILLDIYVFTTLALWCVVEWVLPRLLRLWRGMHARKHARSEHALLSEMIARCIFENSRIEHQGRDTAYLTVHGDEHRLYLLAPGDPEYIEVARVFLRTSQTLTAAFNPSDDESSRRSDDEGGGGVQEIANS
jgi:hypothetical protein